VSKNLSMSFSVLYIYHQILNDQDFSCINGHQSQSSIYQKNSHNKYAQCHHHLIQIFSFHNNSHILLTDIFTLFCNT